MINFMQRHYLWLVAGSAVVLLSWLAFVPQSFFTSRGRMNGDEAIPVLATQVEARNVNVDIYAIGTVQATNNVLVKSQIDGRLMALNFTDGQDVKAGDVLAQIEPTLYQAQYDQARAKKQQDEALLANAQRDLERYLNLAKTEYASKQQADTQRSLVHQLEAQIAADEAALNSARAYLDYTIIKAPISGRTGIHAVDVGNILKASDTNGIVTINEIQPIDVLFTLPQQKLLKIKTAMDRGPVHVEARDAETQNIIDQGTLRVIDNLIDQSTGTIKLKASFPNEQLMLWPGQFVNLKLTVETLQHVTVVPTIAIQRGAQGPFVYQVDDQNIAHIHLITLGYQTEMVSVIDAGVREGDMIITNGFNRLNDGAKIRIDRENTPPDLPAPAQRRRNGERGR